MKKPLLFGMLLTACVVIVAFVFSLGYPGGMISYWKFDEDSGTTASDSVDANDGTLVNGPVWTTGQVGGALSFDGLDDYVTVPSNGLSSNPMTISWWMNTMDMRAVLFMDKNYWYDTEGMEIWLYDNSGGYGYLNVRGSGGTNVASSSDFHGEWVHVAVVFDGTTVKIYRNGALDTSGTIEQIVTSTQDFIMGMYPSLSDWYLNGIIDEVAIYNRVLIPEEIQQHYQDGLHGLGYDVECVTRPSGLVSWLPGDGNADDIQDGNNGTLVNGATFAAGRVDQAFSFDGVDDYVSLGTTQIIGDDTNFTIDAWIKVNSFAVHNKQLPIYGEFSEGTNDTKNYLAVGNLQSGLEQRVFFDQFVPTMGYLKSNIQLIPGRWYHVAYTQDGTTRCLYINGTLDNSDSAIETYLGQMPDDIRIGRRGGLAQNQRFHGLIDELEIYDRALDASEIQAIYKAGSAGKCKVIEVEIDIKPGSYPNSINLGEHGLLPVAILGTPEFDVETIDLETIAIGEITLAERGSKKAPKLAYSFEYVNVDDYTDMMIFFDVQQLVDGGVLTEGTTELLITANLDDGTPIEGIDSVNIVH
jgi:hypothetical protein